jgi:TatD DNase family protein
MLIDTHCHIDLYKNPEKILRECELQGISVISMTNLPSHFEQGFPFFQKTTKCRIALGLHPLYAQSHKSEFNLFLKNIDKTSYIGEVGLDFSSEGINTKSIQIESFEMILQTVSNKKKILSIHSRKAEKEILELLKRYKVKNAIFHWYSGSVKLIDSIIESGYFFSINPKMIQSKNGKDIISKIPLDRLLTESDGPFIQVNQRTINPWDIKEVLTYISETRQLSFIDVERQIRNNFFNLISRLK